MTMLDDDFNLSRFYEAAKKTKEEEKAIFTSQLFKLWDKAQVMEFDDFKGWCKGEGYVVSRFEDITKTP